MNALKPQQVKPGMIGLDYNDEKAKVIKIVKASDWRSVVKYDHTGWLNPKEMTDIYGIEMNKDYLVAVESDDHGNDVYVYSDDGGFYVPIKPIKENMKNSMKLKSLLSEDLINNTEDEPVTMSTEEKKAFLEAVSGYNQFGKLIHRDSNLVEVAKKLSAIAENAHKCTLEETEESFDKITVNRNMKDLKTLSSNFSKVATEAQALQERLSSLYEDMGYILNRYYDINEAADMTEDLTKKQEKIDFNKNDKIDSSDLKKLRKDN